MLRVANRRIGKVNDIYKLQLLSVFQYAVYFMSQEVFMTIHKKINNVDN